MPGPEMNGRFHSFLVQSAIRDVLPADYSKIDESDVHTSRTRVSSAFPVAVQRMNKRLYVQYA